MREQHLDVTEAVKKEMAAEARAAAEKTFRERNLRTFHVTIEVDPQAQDDPDLRYQLAQARHNGERIGLVVGGFNYDVGLNLVQLGSLEIKPPIVLNMVEKIDQQEDLEREALISFATWLSEQEELDVFTADEAVDMFLKVGQ